MKDDAYQQAKQKYAEHDVNTDQALKTLQQKPISIHCWQTDDVTGLEKGTTKGGGILATGNHPGRARNIQEIWTDLEKVLSLTPGTKRINIHAMYGNYTVDRDQIKPEHFQDWINWAQTNNVKLDFNPTLFAHPKADTGFTLSSKDPAIREFWITHVKHCREIADHIGREQGSPCMHNLWIPDGMKDITIDRMGYRTHLRESLDTIYSEKHSHIKDSLESKLFGIASETYVVGSHDFYQAYTLTHGLIPCLDTGHYHPTESVADKNHIHTPIRARDTPTHQPRSTLGQRPRTNPRHSNTGHIPRTSKKQNTQQSPHRPRLLRRQHKPHRRIPNRHQSHTESTTIRTPRTHRTAQRTRRSRTILPTPSHPRRTENHANRSRLGPLLRAPTMYQ